MNAHNKVFDHFSVAQAGATNAAAGYLIGEHGQVLKITEAMIRQACRELSAHCRLPAQGKR